MSDESRLIEKLKSKKVAVVHDWMFVRRGGERVLEQILELAPGADLYCLFGKPGEVLRLKSQHRMFTSFLAKFPFVERLYKVLLPLFPVAIESFDLSGYDLVISSSSCVAKGIIPAPHAKHVCYVHSPMRYAWDQEHRYFPKMPSFSKPLEILRRIFLSRLRCWDVSSAARCDAFIANSKFVAQRIGRYYRRKADVVYPPVELERFPSKVLPSISQKVLLFGAWVPYKKMGEALEALLKEGISVIAAGQGPLLKEAAKKFSDFPNAEFFIEPSDAEVVKIFQQSKILLFPAIEDFGIVPLEAMASGKWVVAPHEGGTGETVVHGKTGLHFQEGHIPSMLNAVKQALNKELCAEEFQEIRRHVEGFAPQRFRNELAEVILRVLEEDCS
jgi:glycosyltransferase involved in cell wall biosynthesis